MLDRVRDTYDTELAGKEFAYDGEKSLFTVGSLPRNKLEFTVVLEDVTSSRCVSSLLFELFLLSCCCWCCLSMLVDCCFQEQWE